MIKSKNIMSEKILLDALDRVAKNSLGYTVLYVNISKLKPKNRHPQFVKIIAKLFDSVVGTTKGVMFVLSNGDIAILSKNTPQDIVDEAVKKLRTGLASDPLLVHDSRDFALVYEFPRDFMAFYDKISKMEQEQQFRQEPAQPSKRPVQASEVENIIAGLDDIAISEIVKRQSVLRIMPDKSFAVAMQEFFVAVKDLSRYFADNIDLVADRWLFQYMSQVLDKKTLAAFSAAELKAWPKHISLNLNLSSIFSREFVNFAKNNIRPGQKIIVEVQVMDILNNLKLYHEALDILHKGGHSLLIDSLNPSSVGMLNIRHLAPDMIKIFWEPLLEYDTDNAALKETIGLLGAENVILAKCDNGNALKWGLSYGINSFQGPYMDEIEAALIHKSCPDNSRCTVQECLKRRRLLMGQYRDECTSKECLEKILGEN